LRDSQLPDQAPEDSPPGNHEGPQGSLRTTGPGLLFALFLFGLVVGRLIRPISLEFSDSAPRVGWLAVFALYFLAAIIGFVAWSTHRTIRRLAAHQAVNRLVLAKSCAIAGALLAGGYFGYLISWIGESSEFAQERLVHSLLAGVASVLIVAGSVLLERACRVRGGAD
jgi:cytochrome bd-type quinol oxidase subunit 2